jgi:hypothetical protein
MGDTRVTRRASGCEGASFDSERERENGRHASNEARERGSFDSTPPFSFLVLSPATTWGAIANHPP